jgi:uncharacterized protein (TIGR02646 family)
LPAPAILTEEGPDLVSTAEAAFNSDPAAYQAGDKTLAIDRDVYGHNSVKESLKEMQNEKCCFCESQITHIAYGDVEHFRPKAAWKQEDNDPLTRPGYYWLAYDWPNLLLCCQLCNQRHKANLFPLVDPSQRAHVAADVTNEEPVFINPSNENPEPLLAFRGDTPFAVSGNTRAARTISGLGLKRKPLRNRRLEKLEDLKLVHQIATGVIPASVAKQNEAIDLMQRRSAPNAEYSSAVKCAVGDGFAFV